eukprot:jgi/Tetstr1/453450/TSEL_040431.t1
MGNMEADRYGMGPEICSLRLTASLSLTPSLKAGSLVTQTDDDQSQAGQGEHLATIREEEHGQEEEEEEEVEEEEAEEGPNTVGAGMELRVPLSVYNKRHSGQDLAKTLKTIFPSFCRKTYRVPEKGKLFVWMGIMRTPGHFACGVWQSRDGALVASVFIYDSCVVVKMLTRTNPYPDWQVA